MVKETNLPMNVDAVVKELTMQENDMEMYINMGKNYLTIFYPKQTPPETDSKTKIQKTNHAFTKSQKSQESINKKIPKNYETPRIHDSSKFQTVKLKPLINDKFLFSFINIISNQNNQFRF